MPREGLVPYSYREYQDGEYVFQECGSLEEAQEVQEFADVQDRRRGNLLENTIQFGTPGRSDTGYVRREATCGGPRAFGTALKYLVFLTLGLFGAILLYLARG